MRRWLGFGLIAAAALSTSAAHARPPDTGTQGTSSDAAASRSGADSRATPATAGSSATTSVAGPAVDAKADPALLASKLHQVNRMEMEMGKLALQNGTGRLHAYANKLQSDHAASDDKLTSLSKNLHYDLDAPANHDAAFQRDSAKMHAKMETLRSEKGGTFDRDFLSAMIDGHRQTLMMARTGRQAKNLDPSFSAFLDETLPTLEEHLAAAERLAGRGGRAQGRASPRAMHGRRGIDQIDSDDDAADSSAKGSTDLRLKGDREERDEGSSSVPADDSDRPEKSGEKP